MAINKRIAYSLIIAGALILGLAAQGRAEAQEEKTTVLEKEVTGEVAGISKNFIAVDFGLNAKGTSMREMAFNLDKNIRIQHKQNLSEISVGDTVTVTYDEITKTDKEGNKWTNCIPKVISFVKPAQNNLSSVAQKEEAPQAEAPQREGLPLKGIRGE